MRIAAVRSVVQQQIVWIIDFDWGERKDRKVEILAGLGEGGRLRMGLQ